MNNALLQMLGLGSQGMTEEERARELMARGAHPGSAGNVAALYEEPSAAPQGEIALAGLRSMLQGLQPGQPDALAPAPPRQIDPAMVAMGLKALHGLTQRGQEGTGGQAASGTQGGDDGSAKAVMSFLRPGAAVSTKTAKQETGSKGTGSAAGTPSGGDAPKMAAASSWGDGGAAENSSAMNPGYGAAGAAGSMAMAAATGGMSPLAEAAIMGGLSLAGSAMGGGDDAAAAQKKQAQTQQRQAGFQRVADLGSMIEQRNLTTKQLLASLRR